MKPALFEFPHIAAYPVMMLLGFLGGWILARRRAPLFGIPSSHLDNISLLLPVAGLFGARFFARLFYAKVSIFEALKVWEGDGLVFYGGFLCSTAVVLLYGLLRRISLVALCDCLAPSVAVGLALGRVGCFLAGCCWGDVCMDATKLAKISDPATLARIHSIPAVSSAGWPLAVRFPQGSEAYQQHLKLGLIGAGDIRSAPVHPVQLYEAGLALFLAVLVHMRSARSNRGKRPGQASIDLLFGYAAIRFLTEFLRADNKSYAWGLTFSQVVSLEIAAGAILLIVLRSFYRREASPPNDLAAVSTPEAVEH